MKTLTKKQLSNISKQLAATKIIAEKLSPNMDQKEHLEYTTKIIENIASIALEVGGFDMVFRDVPRMEERIRSIVQKEDQNGNL